MKRFFRILSIIMCVSALGVHAEEETAPETPTGFAIAPIGEFPEETLERVRAFVEHNTSIETRLLESQTSDADSLSGILDDLSHVNTPEHACVVFLYAHEGFEEHTVYRYEHGVGIVNAAVLFTEDDERYHRRLEKLTMRSVGLLMDVPLVPNPQSAMWTYRTMEELDAMGRNFDPPSLVQIQGNAHERGIPLIKDSPYRMIGPRE